MPSVVKSAIVAVQTARCPAERQRRLYVMRPEGIQTLEGFLAELWPASLRRLRQAVEQHDDLQ